VTHVQATADVFSSWHGRPARGSHAVIRQVSGSSLGAPASSRAGAIRRFVDHARIAYSFVDAQRTMPTA